MLKPIYSSDDIHYCKHEVFSRASFKHVVKELSHYLQKEDYYHVYFFIEGSLVVSDGVDKFLFEPNTAIFSNPLSKFLIEPVEICPLRFYSIHISAKFFNNFIYMPIDIRGIEGDHIEKSLLDEIRDVARCLTTRFIHLKIKPSFINSCKEILSKLSSPNCLKFAVGSRRDLLDLCDWTHYESSSIESEREMFLQRMRDYINDHMETSLSLQMVSKSMGMHSKKISRELKKIRGVSFTEYRDDLRMTKACRLLQSSDDTILQIAYKLGYESDTSFHNFFKKRMRKSPLQWRLENK